MQTLIKSTLLQKISRTDNISFIMALFLVCFAPSTYATQEIIIDKQLTELYAKLSGEIQEAIWSEIVTQRINNLDVIDYPDNSQCYREQTLQTLKMIFTQIATPDKKGNNFWRFILSVARMKQHLTQLEEQCANDTAKALPIPNYLSRLEKRLNVPLDRKEIFLNRLLAEQSPAIMVKKFHHDVVAVKNIRSLRRLPKLLQNRDIVPDSTTIFVIEQSDIAIIDRNSFKGFPLLRSICLRQGSIGRVTDFPACHLNIVDSDIRRIDPKAFQKVIMLSFRSNTVDNLQELDFLNHLHNIQISVKRITLSNGYEVTKKDLIDRYPHIPKESWNGNS